MVVARCRKNLHEKQYEGEGEFVAAVVVVGAVAVVGKLHGLLSIIAAILSVKLGGYY